MSRGSSADEPAVNSREGAPLDASAMLAALRAINAQSPFNAWAGFEIVRAGDGFAEIALAARPELRQHAASLHAGVSGALIDTVCGYAAFTACGVPVVTSHYDIALYAPTTGERFCARARVAKAGKRQIFVVAELFDTSADSERLVAGGSAVLVPLS
jgi:uncharacterized protein (TIGR00369 family)